MNRIPFGAEKSGLSLSTCPDCGTRRGELHHLGCSFDECPACSKPLIHCACLVLNEADALQCIAHLAGNMEAADAATAGDDNKSYYGAAVLARKITWMKIHGTPRARARIEELLKTGAILNLGPVLVMAGLPVRNNPPPAWHDLTGGEA